MELPFQKKKKGNMNQKLGVRPIILSGDSRFEASPSKHFERPYLKNTQHKKQLVGLQVWLK
jgi:hypothetical protein